MKKSISELFKAIFSYFLAFKFIQKHSLWGYFLIPGLISLCIGIIFILLACFLYNDLGNLLYNFYPFEFAKSWIAYISNILGFLVIIFIGLLLYRTITFTLLSPFMSALSIKIEGLYLGKKIEDKTTFIYGMKRGLTISLKILFQETFLVLLLLIFCWIPIVGQIISVIIFIIHSYYIGFSNFDYLMERHFDVKESTKFIKSNKFTSIGNGIGFNLLLMIPILGLFLAPTLSTVSATLLGIDKINESNG